MGSKNRQGCCCGVGNTTIQTVGCNGILLPGTTVTISNGTFSSTVISDASANAVFTLPSTGFYTATWTPPLLPAGYSPGTTSIYVFSFPFSQTLQVLTDSSHQCCMNCVMPLPASITVTIGDGAYTLTGGVSGINNAGWSYTGPSHTAHPVIDPNGGPCITEGVIIDIELFCASGGFWLQISWHQLTIPATCYTNNIPGQSGVQTGTTPPVPQSSCSPFMASGVVGASPSAMLPDPTGTTNWTATE